MDQLICWMEVGLEVYSAECHLDYLLLLIAAGALSLEVELEVYCYHLDYRLDIILLGLVLLLSHWILLLLFRGMDCLMDWAGHLCLDPLPPLGPFGGPAPPDALGLVCKGVHSLGYVTALKVVLL